MSASVDWINIIDPLNNANVTFPNGNYVLPPSSSKILVAKVDLPQSIENVPVSNIRPDLIFKVESGSKQIPTSSFGSNNGGTDNQGRGAIAFSLSVITLLTDDTTTVTATIYDEENKQVNPVEINLSWSIDNTEVATFIEQVDDDINKLTRTIKGISSGQTRVNLNVAELNLQAYVNIFVSQRNSEDGNGGTAV
jgi:hypothetical protein